MRIGIFSETYTPYISGLVTSEVMLKNALEKEGHEVYVVTANLETFKYEYNEKEKVLTSDGDLVERPADFNAKLKAIDIMNKMQGEYVQKIEADVNSEVNINIELSDD